MKKIFAVVLALIMALSLVACGNEMGNKDAAVNYSDGYTVDGHLEGVNAIDLVTLGQYKGIEIPEELLIVSAEDLQSSADELLAQFSSRVEVLDRAVEDGDTLNIDYVGKIDGVEFEGGSTNGTGTEVTIGTTSYIDNFMNDLIGHKVGETFDIYETFPENYGKDELNGKTATFTVTVNAIYEDVEAELTDDFVESNFGEAYDLHTAEDMLVALADEIRATNAWNYILEQVDANIVVNEVPENIIQKNINTATKDIAWAALQYETDEATIYNYYYGVSSEEEFREAQYDSFKEDLAEQIRYLAIADTEGLMATEEDATSFFETNSSYGTLEENIANYGKGYVYLNVTLQKVSNFLYEANSIPEFTAAELPKLG